MLKQLRYIFTLFIFLAGFVVQAQILGGRLKNQPKYDRQRIHFGFNIGINYWDFNLRPIANLATLNGYYSMTSEVSPGYNIGIISNLRLTDHLDLRLIIGFASTERTLYFDIDNPLNNGKRETIERKIQSSFGEIPLELKFKSDRIDNYRVYLLTGVKYNLDLASKEDAIDDRIFKLQNQDFAYELGFGLDFYFEYFKFSPQIKASFGQANLLVEDGTFLIEGFNGLQSRAILINFTFE